MSVQCHLTLTSQTGITGNGSGSAVDGLARYHSLDGVINVTQVSTGGAGTMTVFVQHSPDGGVTWNDIVAQTFTSAGGIGKKLFGVSGLVTPGTTTSSVSDGALATGTVVQGPWGDQLRVKWTCSLGGDTGSFAFSVTIAPKGNS